MAIDSTTAAAASASATGASRTRLAENFDTFLSLLTAQLKNQDPLSPMDANAFTQQIVQMTGVEQQLLTNDLLEKLVANTGGGLSTAVSLIGKQVRAATADAGLSGGKADWIYKLPTAASEVKIEVLDSNGKVVHAKSGADGAAGEHAFSWNGKDASGQQLPDGGQYTLRITAVNASGATVAATTYVEGVVTGVEQVDGQTLLTINRAKIPWDVVSSISAAPAAPTPSSDDNTDSTTPSDATA